MEIFYNGLVEKDCPKNSVMDNYSIITMIDYEEKSFNPVPITINESKRNYIIVYVPLSDADIECMETYEFPQNF